MAAPAPTPDLVYLPATRVLRRYGRTDRTWLWRRMKDPQFPKPLQIAGHNYWRIADLEAYEAAQLSNDACARPLTPTASRAA